MKNHFIMFLTLFGVWIMLNNSLETPIVVSGVVLALLIPFLFCNQCEVFSQLKLSPKSLLYTFLFITTFLWELIKANLDVAIRVLTPSLPINPGIVEVKTQLKSKIGRIILADSITLTPGTFTVEIIEDSLFIHWIDVKSSDLEESTKIIVKTFEKYLEEMYG